MANQHPADDLRQRYFQLTSTFYQEIQRGTPAPELLPLKQEIESILQQIKDLDNRNPADLIRD